MSGTFSDGTTITGGTSGTSGTLASSTSFVPAGDRVESSAIQAAAVSVTPTIAASQKRIRVYHSNHCMHDVDNNVVIDGVISEVSNTYLTASISASDTSLVVNDALAFHKIINGLAISNTNTGFIKIEDEIMSYEAISSDGKTITVTQGDWMELLLPLTQVKQWLNVITLMVFL